MLLLSGDSCGYLKGHLSPRHQATRSPMTPTRRDEEGFVYCERRRRVRRAEWPVWWWLVATERSNTSSRDSWQAVHSTFGVRIILLHLTLSQSTTTTAYALKINNNIRRASNFICVNLRRRRDKTNNDLYWLSSGRREPLLSSVAATHWLAFPLLCYETTTTNGLSLDSPTTCRRRPSSFIFLKRKESMCIVFFDYSFFSTLWPFVWV